MKDISPIANIEVGGYNIHGELVASLVPSFLWTTSAFFTPSVNHRLVQVQSGVNDDAARIISLCGLDKTKYQGFFTKLTRCDGDFRDHFLPRGRIGFSEADIVIAVIGNRLDSELGREEDIFFKDVIHLKENIRFAIFGAVSAATRERLNIVCDHRVKFFGHVLNLQDHLQSVDFFINTRRLGGAGGVAMALYCGVIGCSIDYGDVGDFCLTDSRLRLMLA